MEQSGKALADELNKAVIYQISLRAFTLEGTLREAAKLLPHLADLGIDIVYLCPIVEADDDERREYWSERQKAAKTNNPKNPYRIKDYFKIDEEYGADDDLKGFVDTAHSLGLKVLLDLVYLHCGPNAVFIDSHPDFVQRGENGQIVMGRWHFPLLNFESRGLREYLFANMEYFVSKFQADGYRCDVGDGCPLDFWLEGRKRLEKIKPELIMLNEGTNPAYLAEAFDMNYHFQWSSALLKVLRNEEPAKLLEQIWLQTKERDPIGGKHIMALDTHDIANDSLDRRLEKSVGSDAVEAALLLNHTLDGIPFLYNGYEVADDLRHNLFSNRFYGRDIAIKWSNALTEKGKRRMEFIKKLNALRHREPALSAGGVSWLPNSSEEALISFTRNSAEQDLAVFVNLSKNTVSAEVKLELSPAKVKPLLNRGVSFTDASKAQLRIAPYGYSILEY